MEDAAQSMSPTNLTDANPIPTVTVMESPNVSPSDVSSSEEHTPSNTADLPHLVIQLIQCQHCSRPLRTPLRLPCGNSVCRECLPAFRPRTGITYPVTEGRDQEFTCFWKGNKTCIGDHCVGDCGADVLLGKLAGLFGEILGSEVNNVPRDWSEDDGPLLRWKSDGQNQNESGQLPVPVRCMRGYLWGFSNPRCKQRSAGCHSLPKTARQSPHRVGLPGLLCARSRSNDHTLWPHLLPKMCRAGLRSYRSLPNLSPKDRHDE